MYLSLSSKLALVILVISILICISKNSNPNSNPNSKIALGEYYKTSNKFKCNSNCTYTAELYLSYIDFSKKVDILKAVSDNMISPGIYKFEEVSSGTIVLYNAYNTGNTSVPIKKYQCQELYNLVHRMHDLNIYHGDICQASVLWTPYGPRLLNWHLSGRIKYDLMRMDHDLTDVLLLCNKEL